MTGFSKKYNIGLKLVKNFAVLSPKALSNIMKFFIKLNPFIPSSLFLYPLETEKNDKVF